MSLLQLKSQLTRNSEPAELGDSAEAENIAETQLISISMGLLEVDG